MEPIYLDYNATTPIDKEVSQSIIPFLESLFGNPSSSHSFGVKAKLAVEEARSEISKLIGCDIDEIIFTSGGSEANNLAIKGVAYAHQAKGRHLITSKIEHPAVLEVYKFLQKQGWSISLIGVGRDGIINLTELEAAIRPDTVLISVMHSNNETGTLQPIREICEIAHAHDILVHSDAAQSIGKERVDVRELGVDLLSVAGHKFYAPKGIGALYIRRGVTLEKLIHGADHERNLRAGTENVPEIVGLGRAARIVRQGLEEHRTHMRLLRDRLSTLLLGEGLEVRVNGSEEQRLVNTLSVSFHGVEANTLLSELSGIAASAGAACHSGDVKMSHVLEAMGIEPEWAMGTIRLSTGRLLTIKEVELAANQIIEAVRRLQGKPVERNAEDMSTIKLTHYTHGLGCACKLRPQMLEQVLKGIPIYDCPSLLVGPETSDDAAVYKLTDEMALVETLDFFTPIADDPYRFGQIAAANALSDIYAMGAKPLFALNIAAFPSQRLPASVLADILRGASDKAAEAGIPIVGGHTVDDTEPKFGLAVTGLVHPDKILTNSGAKVGDLLILTKPIGSGIIATAGKQGAVSDEHMTLCLDNMATLNREAAEVMMAYDVNGCTDVTGFGLLGHLKEMVEGAGLAVELFANDVPVLPGVQSLAQTGFIPGGTKDNLSFVESITHFNADLPLIMKYILADAQTSGGLLISLPEVSARDLLSDLKKRAIPAAIVGKITTESEGYRIVVK